MRRAPLGGALQIDKLLRNSQLLGISGINLFDRALPIRHGLTGAKRAERTARWCVIFRRSTDDDRESGGRAWGGATLAENRSHGSIYNFVSFIRKTIKRAGGRRSCGTRGGADALLPIGWVDKATMKIHSRQKRQAARDSLCFRESGEGCQFSPRRHFNVASWSV